MTAVPADAFHPSLATRIQHRLAVPVLSRSAALRTKVRNVAEISDFLDWQASTFGGVHQARTRNALWTRMASRMRASREPWHVIELGVAFGDATRWWLANVGPEVIASWDGFDRFTGLPRAWRDLPAGAIDAGGTTPDIADDRVTWHVGDFEDTIRMMDAGKIADGRRLIYFDFDIYEPSKVAWDWVKPHLRPGDILYFDEAFDRDERRLLNEDVVPSGSYDPIGATSMQLALEVWSLGRAKLPQPEG